MVNELEATLFKKRRAPMLLIDIVGGMVILPALSSSSFEPICFVNDMILSSWTSQDLPTMLDAIRDHLERSRGR